MLPLDGYKRDTRDLFFVFFLYDVLARSAFWVALRKGGAMMEATLDRGLGGG